MLYLKVSNALYSLCTHLCNNISQQELPVFNPHYVITQTDGMNIWLRQQMAHQMGIVANVDFSKPNDLILKIYRLLGGSFMETLSRESLVWFLFQLMGQRDFAVRYPAQREYFNVGGPEKDLKRMGLAAKIADLFDQYQIYRPELIKEWNNLTEDSPNLSWQAFLWIKAKRLSSRALPDKTFVSNYILEQLNDTDKQVLLQKKLPVIYIFGLSILTRYHLNILSKIAAFIDVHFYLLNPAPEIYWIDDKNERDIAQWRKRGFAHANDHIAGNELLTSWGKVLQNTYRLLFKDEALLNNYETIELKEPAPNSLLGKIQNDIFHNATENRNSITFQDLNDKSITIQSNYTAAREVETLYQYLVYLIDKKQAKLSARDIVVMVSDIDAYTPYIHAVFDNALYKFRYKIADVSVSVGDNIFTALEQILLINEYNFTSESVMQLLDSSFIKKRFRITDTEQLRSLVRAAQIRFGMEGNKEDETNLVSWQYGLKRMMLGLCMSGAGAFEADGDLLFPLDVAEGSEMWEITRFVHFVEVLISHVKARNKDRTVAAWVQYVEQLVLDLVFLPDDEPNEEYTKVSNYLKRYNEISELMDEAVPYDIFAHNMVATLQSESRSSMFINDGITFCSLIPMRSIPFKVVAMLGMDYDKFPRRERNISFNLMNVKPELGDRNIKDNDKHLFLETILSAQEYLYISYLGKSVEDNSHKPPSILVEELLAYIQSGIEKDTSASLQLVTEQPLHSYSPRYNQADERLFSYTNKSQSADRNWIKEGKPPKHPEVGELRLSELLVFYKNSLKTYYNKTLGIYLNNEDTVLPETELFELNGLEQWQIKNSMEGVRNEEDLRVQKDYWVRNGWLPLKNVGTAQTLELYNEAAPALAMLRTESKGNEKKSTNISVSLGTTVLYGELPSVYGEKLIVVCWSSNIMRHLVQAYIMALAGIAAGAANELSVINGYKGSVVYKARLQGTDRQRATEALERLVALYKDGLQHKIIFADYLYKDWKKTQPANDQQLANMIKEKLLDGHHATANDPYMEQEIANGYIDTPGISDTYNTAASLVLAPLNHIFSDYFSAK
ncbi:MAG: exodeoxyribonuclease V subunit gamma [Edaphocola sp.]